MLDKNVVMTREKIKNNILQLGKKAVLNSYQDNCFFIINFDNQELIHYIYCLEYAFYHQIMIKKFG